jgi:thioredoxin reductase (NADPH)
LQAAALPVLSEVQVAALGQCTETALHRHAAGQRLIESGELGFKFFVVKSGEIEILDESGDAPRTITVLRAGEFTGDVAHLTGRAAVFSAVARVDCEAYEVSAEALRRILSKHPDLGELILRAFIARRQLLNESAEVTGLRVIGSRYSHDTFRIRDFLSRNRAQFAWLDLETDPHVTELLSRFGVAPADTPVVVFGHTLLLRNPSNRELAEAIGLRRPLDQAVYDLAVVGAGPAGLAAAVYGASEGLSTVALERTAPGGQAGRTTRIENYLGFPTGVSGGELAERAVLQANKFGARLLVTTLVTGLTFDNVYKVLHLDGGETITAKCLLIATGADYRLLGVEGCERFEGSGLYYAATSNEIDVCRDASVIVVGGGNSAGQAAVFLAAHARTVLLVIRGDSLYKDMSAYLALRIEAARNIEVLLHTEVRTMSGDDHLSSVELVESQTGARRTIECPALFSFIGAVPRSEWLPPEIERDAKAFVRTGPALAQSPHWTISRPPFLLEASRPGVFVAGDVRSGSVKRVASAVGEGSMAVQYVHEYLKDW